VIAAYNDFLAQTAKEASQMAFADKKSSRAWQKSPLLIWPSMAKAMRLWWRKARKAIFVSR